MKSKSLLVFFNITEEGTLDRLNAIGIQGDDRRQLAETWPLVERHVDAFLTQLYERFSRTEVIEQFVTQESRVERLKEQQKIYLRELFCSDIDAFYVERRLKVGHVHYQLRITPQWYLAAACHFVAEYIPLLLTADDAEAGMKNVITLLKSVLFDAGLALLSYGYYEDLSALKSENAASETSDSAVQQSHTQGHDTARSQRTFPRPMSRIQLSVAETQARMEFIGLEPVDLEHLRQLETPLATAMPVILEDFYTYLSQDSNLWNLVPAERLSALKKQVAAYWHELANGLFDRPYAASRMRIGVIHEEIGLNPQNYLTGVARQVAGILRSLSPSSPQIIEVSRALIRAVFFDVTFVVDAYMEARASSLLHAEGLAGRVMKGLHSAVAVLDATQRILYANEKLVRLSGIDPALLRMMRLEHALPIPELVEMLASPQKPNQEYLTRLTRWQGGNFLVTVTNTSSDQHYRRAELIVVLEDVSRLQQISHHMQQDAGQYQKLAEQVPAVLWQMDLAVDAIVSISPAAFEMTGLNSSAFLGKAEMWLGCIHSDDRPRFKKCLELVRQNKSGQCEYRLIHRNGKVFWVQTTMTIAIDPQSLNDIISAVTVDVTRLKTTEQLRLSAVSQMAAGVAHVLNNSLTTVNCSIELHAAEAEGLQNAPLLESALRASVRAASIVKQLQAFSGGDVLRPQNISLNSFLRSELPAIQEIAGLSIVVRLKLEPALWTCSVDVDRLKCVLGNLCANAQQAMVARGEIRIETRNLNAELTDIEDPGFGREWIELSFTDNGPGMSETSLRRAFEPFYSERPLAERHGLGLSIAHGFMSQSGGHILIKSAPESGTTVSLRFPRPTMSQLPDNDTHKSATAPLVLIVDDEVPVLGATRAMVQYLGYRVLTAENAAEALRLVDADAPDILLSDISLKDGSDGYQLAQQVTELHPGVKVVLMSGWVSRQSIPKGLSADWLFLGKPYSREEIASILIQAGKLSSCR